MTSLFVGIMSGTSMDGIDAVLVDMDVTPAPRLLASHWQSYPDDLRAESLALQAQTEDELHRAAVLANRLADAYAEAVARLLAEAGIPHSAISAIGCHGQTLRHCPGQAYSIQANNPARLAERTGIRVVADFRSRDIAAGGQGAPLVPAFHAAVFGHPEIPRAILNIGGIANLTALVPHRTVIGFDTGPGNLLLDAWIERHKGCRYDANGDWAATGTPIPALLADLLSDNYFTHPPPKSCGRDQYHLGWLEKRLRGDEQPEDVQASLLELTVITIARAVEQWCEEAREVWVCGGGVHNHTLLARLRHGLPGRRIAGTDSLGLPPDWVEAMAFAWLAWRTLHGQAGNLPDVTGARGARVLGAIHPA